MIEEPKKDGWDKAKAASGLVASLLIPVALAFIGHWSTEAIKSKEISVKYTELAISVLNQPSTPENKPLREWAADVLNSHSGVSLKQETKNYLIENSLLEFVDEQWAPAFSEAFAKEFVENDAWEEFINSDTTKEEQAQVLQRLMDTFYKRIVGQKKRLINSSTKAVSGQLK